MLDPGGCDAGRRCEKCGGVPDLIYRWRADRIWECGSCFFRWRTNERLP